jgi:hypothetical protein
LRKIKENQINDGDLSLKFVIPVKVGVGEGAL